MNIPDEFLKKLNRIIFNFILGSNTEKVKRAVLTDNYLHGGINITDIKNQMFSFRLKWLGQFFYENSSLCREMGNFWFDQLGGLKLLLNCNYDKEILKIVKDKNIPKFYGEVLYAWLLIRSRVSRQKKDDKAGEILWFNQNITFNRNMFFL